VNQRELEKAIAREVEEWPGAEVAFVAGGKHPKAKLSFEGKMLAKPFSGTPSDALGMHRALADVRRILKQLGAERSKPAPSKDEDEAPYRKPNDGREKRPDPVRREPAEPKPDVAEQLVDAGLATPEQAEEARRPEVSAPTTAAPYGEEEDDEDDEDDETAAKRAAVRATAEAIVDGVYFGLPDEVYHSVPRLSASGLQRLAISPATFWCGSWLDPDSAETELDEEATKAQVLGKAYHCARLEPDTFHDRYVRKPEKSDYPAKGLITSDAGIKAALKDLGETQSTGTETIPDRARRLVDAGHRGTIWALVIEEFEAQRRGRVSIEARFFDQIVTDMERIKESGEIAELLSNGFAEVSVFWTDVHGLKMKARLDFLTVEHWSDLKTFDNSRGKALDQAIADFVRYNRVHIQAATYRDATEAIRVGGLDVIGPATEAQRKLVYDLRTRAKPLRCWYVFTEKGGVPNILGREFRFHGVSAYVETEIDALVEEGRQDEVREALGSATAIYSRALWEIDRAKRDFVLYSEVYEPGRPWFPIEARRSFSDLEFNQYWLEGKA
jgi:hypothetical protein